ncbi:MAG TPA: DUF4294 domain-containing protein [Flavobacteriales bacterium]|jgi:hypothetical protein|nr:DUF4294 domain-containing protein [Flavobacteriales bacterium]HPH83595.1 DUF4294 domain-containing protein [Flavobacteriales bacterium]
MRIISFSLIFLSFSILGRAQILLKERIKLVQDTPAQPTGFKVSYIITDSGDTLPVVTLHPVSISEKRSFSSKREERKWSRLKRDVAKVYPYSKVAGKKLKEYNDMMIGKSEREQKKMLRVAEEDLKKEFEGDIRNMTLNQGRILIKLIDRETGNTSYGLVKDLRGSFQAFFWQSLARIFKTNLKSSYDPNNNAEDKMIEDIIESIEDGTFVN